ncbi:MAG: serine/threonine protein kinase [Labilithrix sp.]|nr:serine/threonine protein kinase [Labilithrix sp.]
MYPQVFGKYVLERELSRGGMARVVLATLRGAGGFEKKLVVKQIRDELSFDSQFVRRFVEEAKTTVALSHPNIVPVYELGVEQGTYFLAMELVEGCSIAELVRERDADGKKRVLTPEEGAYVGMEVCRALDYAHRRMKVVHRDITPRNVMLDEEGQVKLIDFGIAAPALVAGHEILGSPGHMPPEQVEGKELGPPTDIFAIAVLLMEAWSGIAPFRRATPEECDEAMRAPHPRPSDYDPRLIPLDDVITRAMKLDPKQRQQDASALGRALRSFLQGTDVGDIARALGDRVRELRENATDSEPKSSHAAMRATNPSHGDLGTQTFAARDEAIRWSRPPAAEIDEGPAVSTRKLPEASPSSPDFGASDEYPSLSRPRREEIGEQTPVSQRTPVSVARRGDPNDPVMSIPTPLMVEPVGAIEEAVLRAARADRARAKRNDRSDTIATRPLETPIDASRPSKPSQRSRALLPIVLVVAVGVGGGFAWRARSNAVGPEVRAPSTATAPAPTAVTPSATVSAAVPVVSAAPEAPPSAAIVIATPHVAHPTTSASTQPPAEKAGKAMVAFLGDPGTRVSIDGVARGSCPVRLSLDPGQHDARFTFDPTGESHSIGFRARADEKLTVRAEFTGATPTVKIIR